MDARFVNPQRVPFPLDDGAEPVLIGPANMLAIAELLEAAPELVERLVKLADVPGLAARFESGSYTASDVTTVMLAVADKGRDALELVSIATGIGFNQVAAMLPDRFAMLFALVVQVNADFFSQARPTFEAAMLRLRQAASSGGAPSPLTGTSSSAS